MRKVLQLRVLIVAIFAVAILTPVLLLVYQSFLSGSFFAPNVEPSLDAYQFVLTDPQFWLALRNSLLIAAGMAFVAIPLGTGFAFLIARTDIPFKRVLGVVMILPMLMPSIIVGFGYIVAAGPTGLYSNIAQSILGFIPWTIYSPWTIIILSGFGSVPYVYLYTLTALSEVSSEMEEAARVSGANPIRTAANISLPLVTPAIAFSGVLVAFLGIELFGLPLILGAQADFDPLSVYLYKLTNRFGVPSYPIMATVVLLMIAASLPLVLIQRRLTRSAERFVSIKGKGSQRKLVSLGAMRWVFLGVILIWILLAVFVPLSGVVLRAFVNEWGSGVNLFEQFTWNHLEAAITQPSLSRSILNTVLLGTVGGLAAVACFLALALALRRQTGFLPWLMDHLVLIPRAIPGLAIGLVFLWVFLFVPGFAPLRSTLVSIWVAYMVVWLSYGLRLLSTAQLQIAPELEEAARVTGASPGRTLATVTMPLMKRGILSAWLLIFLMFVKDYSTGVYLMTSGNEVIGSLLISLSESGEMAAVAALSLINIVLIGTGLAVALRFGVRLNE